MTASQMSQVWNWMHHTTNTVEGLTTITGPNANEILKAADGWTVAVRPLKSTAKNG